MKSSNYKEINQAYNRFLVWFASLLLVIIACVYSYVETSSNQLNRLIQQKEAFDRIFFTDAMLANSVDSLYANMNLLNTNAIRDNRQMQRRITKKREDLIRLVNQKQKTQQYFAVYNRLFGHVNEMLLLKDSISRAMTDEIDLKEKLEQCSDSHERTRKADQQRKQTVFF